ncbi:MAG: hypothetical protein HYS80_02785 [Candidatus Aenigmarchaeota archaeon]|nr:hypothetical protein [Candidatus Aenigmarchaeota archaeon]
MDISNTFDEDKIVLDVRSVDVCFAPALETQYTNVVVHYDSGLLVPIVLKNNGIKKSELNVYLSGSAVDFSKLGENEIDLDPGQNKTVYLYLAPKRDTAIGQYALDLELYTGNDFYKATRMNVEVTDDPSRVTAIDGAEETAQQESWAGLKYFLRTYKYYLVGGLAVFIIIVLALIFGRKAINFFDEDFEEEKTKKKKKN